MRVPNRPLRIAADLVLAALVGAALIVAVLAWDATLLRPAIQRYVQQRSARQVDFRELRLGLDAHLAPTVRVFDLRVENAAWADATRPVIRAGELDATFELASLLHGDRIEITQMRLVDADIDLEVQADGLRNWRITRPDDRGPGRVRVQVLQAERSRARIVHHGLGLDLQLRMAPLAAPQVLQGLAPLPLTQSLDLSGTRDAVAFDGRFDVSDAISLYDSGRPFALHGELRSGDAHLALQGQANDLLQLAGFDGRVHAQGTQFDRLAKVFRRTLPRLPPLPSEVDAQLRKTGGDWRIARIDARVGHSDVSGSADYRAAVADPSHPDVTPARQLRATLASRRIDVAEWHAGFGDARASPAALAVASPASAGSAGGTANASASTAPLDAQVDWQVAQLDGLPLPVAALHAHASWRDARLTLAPFAFQLAGGAASGRVSLAPEASSADLAWTGLRLERLGVRALSGQMDGRLALRSRGASIASMLAALTGSAEAELHGATLPAALDAKLGLDGGRWLRAMVGGRERRIPVLCSRALVRVDHGIVAVQQLALETANLQLSGSGSVDLPHRRVQVSLTPRRKQASLLALDDSIEVGGALNAPTITLARHDDPASPGQGCG